MSSEQCYLIFIPYVNKYGDPKINYIKILDAQKMTIYKYVQPLSKVRFVGGNFPTKSLNIEIVISL